MAYDPCNPTAGIPAAPGGAHHHHFHRIVGRIRPRPHPVVRVSARPPVDPNGCAKAPPGGAMNTPRPGVGGAGLGAGKLAALGGVGGAGLIGGGVLGGGGGFGGVPGGPGGGGGGGIIKCATGTVLNSSGTKCITTGGGGGNPGGPGGGGPGGPGGGTPVPEPATMAVFAMALGAICLARIFAARRPEASRVRS